MGSASLPVSVALTARSFTSNAQVIDKPQVMRQMESQENN